MTVDREDTIHSTKKSSIRALVSINQEPSAVTFLKKKNDTIKKIKICKNIKEHRNLVRAPNEMDVRFHRKTRDKATTNYFTEGRKITKFRNVFNETRPYAWPSLTYGGKIREFAKINVLKEGDPHYLTPNYRGKQNHDLLERVHVPVDLSNVPLSKVDVDPEYFTIVRGRPMKSKLDKREYRAKLRKLLLEKIQVGFLHDEVLKKEEHHALDTYYAKKIKNDFKHTTDTFDQFLAEEHAESVNVIKHANRVSQVYKEKVKEIKKIKSYINAMKCALFKLSEKLQHRKFCKIALYKISPEWWKQVYHILKLRQQPHADKRANSLLKLYEQYKKSASEDDSYTEQVIVDLIEDTRTLGPSILFFEHTWQIDYVFRAIELADMEGLVQLDEVEKGLAKIKKTVESTITIHNKENSIMNNTIKVMEDEIKYQTERSEELESAANNLINDKFREALVNEETLETMALVEQLHEEVVAPNVAQLSAVDMMKNIENKMFELWEKLSDVPPEYIEEHKDRMRKKKEKELSIATKAKHMKNGIDQVFEKLTKSYIPYVKLPGKTLKPRSEPPSGRAKKLLTGVLRTGQQSEAIRKCHRLVCESALVLDVKREQRLKSQSMSIQEIEAPGIEVIIQSFEQEANDQEQEIHGIFSRAFREEVKQVYEKYEELFSAN